MIGFPHTFLLQSIDWQKIIKLRDTNYFTSPPLSLLFLSSLSSNTAICAMYITQARAFQERFLVEARSMHLRRLRREGSPERH